MVDTFPDRFDQITQMVEQVLKKDALFNRAAKLLKKSMDALIAVGFSRTEAIQIIVAHGSIAKCFSFLDFPSKIL